MVHPTGGAADGGRDSSPAVLMLLTNAYDPDPRVRQEALALIAMGCRVTLLAWDRDHKSPASEWMEGVQVERVFLRSKHGRGSLQIFFYALLYLQLFWRGWRIPFDAVHCHDLDTLPLGYLLGKLQRKPIVYDAHESFPDMLAGNVPAFVRNGLVRLENYLIRRVDLLITVGEKLRRHFANRGCRHSVVVGNWKRLSEFARTGEENLQLRRTLGIPDGALLVMCITQLLKDRQLSQLLQATDECPDVFTVIGGKGVLEPLVKEWAARNPRVRYIGFVSNRDIPALTCASDVIYYGFDPDNPNAQYSAPNKLFEALAAGKPLVSGDFGEIADVIRTASCGVILSRYTAAEVRRALLALQDHTLRNVLAGNARRMGRNSMNWEKAEETLYREYSTLLPGTLRKPTASEAAPLQAMAGS